MLQREVFEPLRITLYGELWKPLKTLRRTLYFQINLNVITELQFQLEDELEND